MSIQQFSLFLSPIPKSIASDKLRAYFSEFGDIDKIKMKKGKGRKSASTAQLIVNNIQTYNNILSTEKHQINGITFSVRRYLTGESLLKQEMELAARKISIFKIRGNFDKIHFEKVLSQFGTIAFSHFMQYRENAKKSYGFVTYETRKAAQEALRQGSAQIYGQKAIIKPFTLKSKKFKNKTGKPNSQEKQENPGFKNQNMNSHKKCQPKKSKQRVSSSPRMKLPTRIKINRQNKISPKLSPTFERFHTSQMPPQFSQLSQINPQVFSPKGMKSSLSHEDSINTNRFKGKIRLSKNHQTGPLRYQQKAQVQQKLNSGGYKTIHYPQEQNEQLMKNKQRRYINPYLQPAMKPSLNNIGYTSKKSNVIHLPQPIQKLVKNDSEVIFKFSTTVLKVLLSSQKVRANHVFNNLRLN